MAGRPRSSSRPDPALGLGTRSVTSIYRGRQRRELIIELAMDVETPVAIAKRLGLPPDDIVEFRKEHERDIAEVQQALLGQLAIETAGLWITKKHLRLAEYQHEAEQVSKALEALRDQDEEHGTASWSRAHRDMIRTRLDIFRHVADELGAYPQRQAPVHTADKGVRYVIDTEDDEVLT